MKRNIRSIFTSLAVTAAFVSCETAVVPDGNVRYEYMFDCLWTLDAHSRRQTEIPALFMDPGKHLFFTAGGKMAVLEKRIDVYRYTDDYSCLIDMGSDKMTLSGTDGESYYFVIDRVCETHMTLLYNGKDTEYITYRRSDIADGGLDESSFPGGWFD